MGVLYNRRYSLLIGETKAQGVLVTTEPLESDTASVNNNVLNIEFSITKSYKADAKNTARITIYNLSNESIDKIVKDNKVILKAGYEFDGIRPIFLGQVENVSSEVHGEVVKTIINCIDGYTTIREGFTAETFSPTTTVETILRTIITQDLGFANPRMNNGKLGPNTGLAKIYQGGSAKVGDSAEIVSRICSDNFLTWNIRDGEVFVYPVDGSTGIEVPLISVESGMLGTPRRSLDNSNKAKDSKDLKDIVKVKVLLQGVYNVGDLVKVESLFTNGLYRISKLTHKGSYDGTDWVTDLELSEGVKVL